MRTHNINRSTSIEFHPLKSKDFIPKIIQDGDVRTIPLLIMENEIDRIINKLSLINFIDLPIHYIEMIVAGCISIVLKYSYNN